jgi:trehalose/maltose hydrolase-like predicted phosphorylase
VRTETATNNTGYFLTGSGAYVQNLLYGFTGLRIREAGLEAAYAPLLPAAWKSLTLRDVTFRGQHYDVVVARDASGRVALTRQLR